MKSYSTFSPSVEISFNKYMGLSRLQSFNPTVKNKIMIKNFDVQYQSVKGVHVRGFGYIQMLELSIQTKLLVA